MLDNNFTYLYTADNIMLAAPKDKKKALFRFPKKKSKKISYLSRNAFA